MLFELGVLKPSGLSVGGHGPKAKEQSLSAKFAAWFNTTFANLNPQWKQKAILASQEATLVILMKA